MGDWLPLLVGIGIGLGASVPVIGWAATRWVRRRAGDRRGATPARRTRPARRKVVAPTTRPRSATRKTGTTRRTGTTGKTGTTRRTGTTRKTGAPVPTRTARPRPRPGEIWWADVPYVDGTGSKVRPCLVLRTRRGGADVLKITSREKGDRADHVRMPTRQWDPKADRDSFLDALEPIRVTSSAFDRLAGTCDPKVWRAVRRLHGVPLDR